ncbi:endonuclease/Exonuclease/phosphatase [Trypanosoma rangeli]|uniref:Endonuclease/Exonuclease/phosphatase n=1 Tax=Trypanosoma rangeli TaxID=5698 RepID=A0A422NTW4_TRYRA|nr:endonuclease/Exonuclease/phosphatase [Trypanosoma rangeli]RNF08905.1 endonuclease/Exonuclease/phosphatase [Trypanosoma rangeli]|eukprot:RNF08905.1 endonuclease/Exonuclease/phosphatase [Trypanosoma rangeli]
MDGLSSVGCIVVGDCGVSCVEPMNTDLVETCRSPQTHEEANETKSASVKETDGSFWSYCSRPSSSAQFDTRSPVSLNSFASVRNEQVNLRSSIEQYSHEHQTVSIVVNEETCPVPVSLSENMWVPGKPLRISYVSWNMGHRCPNFEDVARYCIHPNAHIVVVCTQENGTRLLVNSDRRKWKKHVDHTCLDGKYVLVGRKELWYIQLLVYARREDVASYIRCSDATSVRTGIANGLCGNKGGVAVALSISMIPLPLQRCAERRRDNDSLFGGCMRSLLSSTEVYSGDTRLRDKIPLHNTVAPSITLLFIGAHLAAHQKGVRMRNKDYLSIVRAMYAAFQKGRKAFCREHVLPKGHFGGNADALHNVGGGSDDIASVPQCENAVGSESAVFGCDDDCTPLFVPRSEAQTTSLLYHDVTEEFDLVFFGGDLNYRINGTRRAIEYMIKSDRDIRSVLAHNDQLNLERAKGIVFRRFCEGNLLFRPTYKYEIEQDVYNYTKKKDRMPAYCDRVLYKRGRDSRAGTVKIRLYTDVPQVRTSDHRPIVAIFDVATCVCPPP